jgi:hypothetical protein
MRPNSSSLSMLERLEPRTLLTTVTVAPVAGSEGDASVVFTAMLDAPASADVTIGYRTANGSARGGEDFKPVRTSLFIPAGATSGSGSVTLIDDGLYEPEETFGLALTAPRGVKLASKRVVATLVDDSPIPNVSIADAAVLEGGKGHATVVTANVALSHPAAQTVRINYQTQAASTATVGSDYRPARGAVVFRPGQVTAAIKLRIVGDDVAEPDESFRVMLAASPLALVTNPFAEITITNDDSGGNSNNGPLPFVSIAGPTPQLEGNAGDLLPGSIDFIVTLAASSAASLPANEVTVAYATTDGTATAAAAGGDYVSATGVLTFSAGETAKTISVSTSGDDVPELDETFSVLLTQSNSAIITTGTATATLVNDDAAGEPLPPPPPPPPAPLPSVSIVSTSAVTEGNLVVIDPQPIPVVPPVPDTTTLQIPVILSAASASVVTVDYQTGVTGEGPGHADGGIDYAATTGVLSFAPGQTVNVISIAIAGDIEIELDETFTVTLTGAGNATLDGVLAVITIFNDDVP